MSNESGVEELSNRDQMFQVHDEGASAVSCLRVQQNLTCYGFSGLPKDCFCDIIQTFSESHSC